MKNNGMGKFEIFGIIVLVVAGFTFVVNYLLDNSESQRLVTMKKSTESFGRIVSMNRNFFHNRNEVYLGEVIDEGYINNIISPFSKKDCSPSESKVIFNQGNSNNDYTVILKCDEYIIYNEKVLTEENDSKIYKVGNWQEEVIEGDNVESKTLYNCMVDGIEKYSEYYDELYLLSRVNLDYGTDHYSKNSLGNECPIVEKTFYRSKKLIK